MGFVYGIPILLIGLALKYAQLDPVPVEVSQLVNPPMDFNMAPGLARPTMVNGMGG